jgi:hypothetical protein
MWKCNFYGNYKKILRKNLKKVSNAWNKNLKKLNLKNYKKIIKIVL